MTSCVFSYLKKATHVFVIASYLFHGVAPAFATRTFFNEVEERQQKVSSIDVLRSTILRERQREETIRQEQKREEAYDGRHQYFTPRATFDEDGYTLKIQSVCGQINGSVWPGVQMTLIQKDGDWVKTLEHRTFSSMPLDEEEQENFAPLKDRKNRSLGFSYDLKGVGRIYVCWEGSLLLHNLHFRGTALNIQTTGAILANNLDGSRLNLEGRAIAFGGDHNKISTLSMGFSEGLQPAGFGSRMAQIMPGTILVTHDLSVQGGILQNQGRLSAINSFECHDTHVINDDHINAEKFTLKGGTLQNQGTLKATLTAEGMDLVDNSGVMEGSWSAACNSFVNTGDIKGTGSLKTNVLENYGFLGDAGSVFNIQKTGHNDGAITARKVTGHGTFINHNVITTDVLDIPVFQNQQRENVPFKPFVKGDSLSITKRVRQFTSDKDSTIAVKRLVMETREGVERQVQNDGVIIEGDQITLQGNVENKGSITTKNFAWQGSTFKTEHLKADYAQLEGKRLQNLGNFKMQRGSLLLHQLQNQGDMNLDGFVTVLSDGRLKFGNPVFHVDTWQSPQHIQGPLGQGVHLSVSTLDSLKKIPDSELHVYGKSFSNTSDHAFLHPLHLIVDTFKNTKTLRAPELSVMASTIENDGSITGNRLTLHASQNGQNKGRLEATHHLEVVLPFIDYLGSMVSKGDLFFKTTERDFTFDDSDPWLKVGRHLCMALFNGNLSVNTHLSFPGDTRFRASTFTLQGSVEAAGDLEVQTQGDINVVEEEHRIETTEDLLNRLKTLSCNANGRIETTEYNQTAVRDFIKHLKNYEEASIARVLRNQGYSDRPDIPYVLPSLEEVLDAQYYPWSEIVRAIEEHLRQSPTLSHGKPRSPLHTITLSRMKSGDNLILSGQNVNNSGGEIQGESSLKVIARGDITHGSTYENERLEYRPYLDGGALWFYSVPEIHGNGSAFISSGPLDLQAGNNILNNHSMVKVNGKAKLTLFSGGTTINKAGRFLSGDDADFRGGSFQNIRSPIADVATGPYETGTNSGRWFVNDQSYIHGKNKEPRREYATSGPAYVQTLGNLTLDFSDSILNEASEILVGGALHETNAEIINTHIRLLANAKRDWNAEWIPVPSVVADTLQGVISSGMRSSIQTLKKVLNSAIFVAPDIDVKARSFHVVKSTSGGREPQRKEETGSIIRAPLHHYARPDEAFKGMRDPLLGSFPQVLIGSPRLPSQLSLNLDPMQMAFAMQRGLSDTLGKGYVFPYRSLFEQLGILHKNARHLALQSKGGARAIGWRPLMVSEEEASQTTVPLMLYRVVELNKKNTVVPECWIPQNYRHPALKKGRAAVVADAGSLRSHTTEDTLIKGGTAYGHTDVDMEAEDFAIEDHIERHHTSTGYEDVRTEGEVLSGNGGPMNLRGRNMFSSSGARIEAPDASLKINGRVVKFGASECDSNYEDGKTTRRTKTHYPTHMTGGTIDVDSKTTLDAEAPQVKAKSHIKFRAPLGMTLSSVIDTLYHEERKFKRSFLGTTKSTETTQSATHQVARLELEDDLPDENAIEFHTTQGNIDATAPIITAPTVVFDFPKGSLLFDAFENWSSYNREELDKNAFLINSSVNGFSSTQRFGPQVTARKIVTSDGRPMGAKVHEDQLKDPNTFIQHLQQKGAILSTVQDEFQSWEETKTFVGPGLSALIMIGVSLVMPGIGTGTTGAMLTAGAETLSTQAVVGMINNDGNILQTLEDMASADSLRSTAISMATAGLTNEFSIMSGVPIHPKGVEFVKHLESRMLHMAAQIPVESVLSRKSFGEVFQDCLIHGAAKLVGTYGSANIGRFFDKHQITEFQQYLAHAAVGAAAAKIKNGDVVAGALGAVVGEAVGKRLRAEMDESSINEDHPDYEQAVDYAVNIARFTAASVACGLNQDAEEAAFAAGNAARHNAWSYNPYIPSVDQIETDVRRFVEYVDEGITSYAEAGEDLAEAVSDNVGLGGICRDALRSMGHDAGLVAGIGLSAVGMRGGKRAKAPRIRKAPRAPIIPSNATNLGAQQPVSILPTPPKLPPQPGISTGKGVTPSSTIQKPNASTSKSVGQPKKLASKPTPKTQTPKKVDALKQKTQTQSLKKTDAVKTKLASKSTETSNKRRLPEPTPAKPFVTPNKIQRTLDMKSPGDKSGSSKAPTRYNQDLGTSSYSKDLSKGFYDSHAIRQTFESQHPGKVSSHTVPSSKAKNVRLAGQRHPTTGIVFDQKGFPIFNDIAKFDTRIPRQYSLVKDPKGHMRAATRNLRENIQSGKISPDQFTKEQLADIKAGKEKINGFTWHHHQDTGRMQLIPEEIHEKVGHVGGMDMWLFQE